MLSKFENLSKIHAELRKILKFQKASRSKKNNKNDLNHNNNRKKDLYGGNNHCGFQKIITKQF